MKSFVKTWLTVAVMLFATAKTALAQEVSDFAELQAAITASTGNGTAASPVLIQIASDITITAQIEIGTNRHVEITSASGETRTLTDGLPGGAAFYVRNGGTLTLENIVIEGKSSGFGSSVSVDAPSASTFTMNEGAIIRNTLVASYAVSVSVGMFIMNGGEISNNNGGGVHLTNNSSRFNMNGGIISDNTAFQGAGVRVDNGTFRMSGGTITGNTSTTTSDLRGGGVIINIFGSLILGGDAVIENNKHTDGSTNNVDIFSGRYITLGTGLNEVAAPTTNMSVGITKNSDNGVFVQSGASDGDEKYFFPDAGGEIEHDNGSLKIVGHNVSFDPNGGTGTMTTVFVNRTANYTIAPNTFTKSDYVFAKWNTLADGTGTDYAEGATIENVTDDITLYAQWIEQGDGTESSPWLIGRRNVADLTAVLHNGTLTISGNGEMRDYNVNSNNAPWMNRLNDIREIIIGNDVTSIGEGAFYGCSNLTSVIIGSAVDKIGAAVFRRCSNLNIAHFLRPADMTSIGNWVFDNTHSSLKVYGFEANETLINYLPPNGTFSGNPNIEFVPYVFGDLSVDLPEEHTFASASYGYGAQTPLEVTYSNYPLPLITVELEGDDKDAFVLSDVEDNVFTVTPALGLAVGTYEATVTVTSIIDDSQESFDVSFTVGRAAGAGTVSIDGWTFGEAANTPQTEGGTGTPTFAYKVQGADDDTYSETVPTNAGDYTVRATFAESDNYFAHVGTADFMILRKARAVPVAIPGFIYTGEEHLGLDDGNGYTVQSGGKATNAGEHTAVVIPDGNHQWISSGGFGENVVGTRNVPWNIAPMVVIITPQWRHKEYSDSDPALTYTTSPSVLPTSWETDFITLKRAPGEDVGNYPIELDEDNSSTNYDVDLSKTQVMFNISRKAIKAPTATQNLFFTGLPQTGVEGGTGYSVTGVSSAINVGDYTAFVEPDGNHRWHVEGGVGGPPDIRKLDIEWTIAKAQVDKPTLVQSQFEFDGFAKTVELTSPSELYEISSGETETDIGEYTAWVSLIDADNYRWKDGDSEPLGLEWSIDAPTSIRDRKNTGRGMWFVTNPTKDVAEIRVTEGTITRVVVYDAIGNIVHDGTEPTWNLTNTAGRFVANGTYLVVVETKDQNGRIHRYSARLGVKR
jgi:uncharacterized repeat protein (TIGR02543 family)